MIKGWKKWVWMGMVFVGVGIVGAARVGVGVHSLDQVIGGVVMGVSVNLVVIGTFREKVEGVFMAMESGRLGVYRNWIFWVYIGVNLVALCFMLPEVEGILINVPEAWMVNMEKV